MVVKPEPPTRVCDGATSPPCYWVLCSVLDGPPKSVIDELAGAVMVVEVAVVDVALEMLLVVPCWVMFPDVKLILKVTTI